MSTELVKVFGKDALTTLDDDAREKYQRLVAKITNTGSVFEEYETEWRPSRLRLCHPVTSEESGRPENAKTGDLFYAGGIVERPMKFLLAYAYPSRVRFVQDVDKRPSCSAENVDIKNYGAKDTSTSIYGDKCAECPHDDQPFRYGKPTSCNNQMNALIIPDSLEDIFIYQFSKSSWSVGRQLVDQATAFGVPWSRWFTLDSKEEKRQNGSGKFAVPIIRAIDPKDDDVPDHAQAFAKFINESFTAHRREIRTQVVQKADDVDSAISTDTLDVVDDDSFEDKM